MKDVLHNNMPSTFRHGAKHHPSWGMHLLRGELIAYNYAFIIMDAVLMIEEFQKNSTNEEALKGTEPTIHSLRFNDIACFSSF